MKIIRRTFRWCLNIVYKPIIVRQLKKDRKYKIGNIRIAVKEGVFPPRFFFSTRFLGSFINNMKLEGKQFLELGSGSGYLSVMAALKGAIVTASDINIIAVDNVRLNARINKCKIEAIHSNLFDRLQGLQFDIIVVNPPYYRGLAIKPIDHAFYLGEDDAYYTRFFADLGKHTKPDSQVILVLSEDAKPEIINKIAMKEKFFLKKNSSKSYLAEYFYIYSIENY